MWRNDQVVTVGSKTFFCGQMIKYQGERGHVEKDIALPCEYEKNGTIPIELDNHGYTIRRDPESIEILEQYKGTTKGGVITMPRIFKWVLWVWVFAFLFRLADPMSAFIIKILTK